MTVQEMELINHRANTRELEEQKAPKPYDQPVMIDLLWMYGTGE